MVVTESAGGKDSSRGIHSKSMRASTENESTCNSLPHPRELFVVSSVPHHRCPVWSSLNFPHVSRAGTCHATIGTAFSHPPRPQSRPVGHPLGCLRIVGLWCSTLARYPPRLLTLAHRWRSTLSHYKTSTFVPVLADAHSLAIVIL